MNQWTLLTKMTCWLRTVIVTGIMLVPFSGQFGLSTIIFIKHFWNKDICQSARYQLVGKLRSSQSAIPSHPKTRLSLRENPNSFQAMFVAEKPLALASNCHLQQGWTKQNWLATQKWEKCLGTFASWNHFIRGLDVWFLGLAHFTHLQPSSISQLHLPSHKFEVYVALPWFTSILL